MKRTICHLSAATALAFVFSLTVGVTPKTASAGEYGLDEVLGLNHPDCCHVIDLLMHNRIRKSMAPETAVLPTPFGIAGPKLGDLELLEVNLVSEAGDGCGPVYQVSFRNTSAYSAHNFRISIVGVCGRITPTSPCTMVTIACLNAGETKCIEMQLPASAMTMGPAGAEPAPFDTLIVALDSFDELFECDELNNVAILKRVEIGLVVTEAPATMETPAAPAPAEAAPTGPTAAAPGENTNPSPLENINLDELDLGDAEESALRIALETM